ncbi:MAG: glycosyltransferase, partial [Waterburya sp.]
MKILLIAFECEPNRGSEFGRGWVWANELASTGHEIWVITCSNNQPKVEKELQINHRNNLHFIYCKQVSWLPWAYKVINTIPSSFGAKMVSQVAKTWWQWDVYQIAKSLTQELQFDLVHHVTNTTVRRPSFMGLLGIPFILGPLAGGVRTPWFLRKSYPLIGWLSDLFRDLANGWVKFDPLMHLTFAKATKIYCDSKQTQVLIPKLYRSKSEVVFSMPTYEIAEIPQVMGRDSTEKEIFRVLFVGRFLYWKGIHLALKAFAQLRQKIPSARFTMIGDGREQAWLQGFTKKFGVEEAVDWIPWMERKELIS